jgi:hypothetical protein
VNTRIDQPMEHCATRTPLNPGLNSGAPEGSAISDGRRITVNRDEHYTIDDFR